MVRLSSCLTFGKINQIKLVILNQTVGIASRMCQDLLLWNLLKAR